MECTHILTLYKIQKNVLYSKIYEYIQYIYTNPFYTRLTEQNEQTHLSTLFNFNDCEQSDKGVSGSLIQQALRVAYHHFQPLNTISGKSCFALLRE